ncbi:TPA: hypothetical protein RMI67_006642 [Bacillus cereus]|nr:hypothetical protein [Bacillus cereus]
MNLIEKAKKIRTQEDFTQFVMCLAEDFKHNPKDWENVSIHEYLFALASWVEDMDGYYKNQNIPLRENIDWSFLATILLAAKVYE